MKTTKPSNMKLLHIPAIKTPTNQTIPTLQIQKLPKKLILAYSIQYKQLALQLEKQLTSQGFSIPKTLQVLGCSTINNQKNLPILLISTGTFHAKNLYLQTPQLFLLQNNKISKIPSKEIKNLKTQRKTALLKFLSANNIGILVTTKPGQENLKKAIKLKQKLSNKKQSYIFISNNIDSSQFENFQIQSWINTACKGLISDDNRIINPEEIPKNP